MNDKLFISQAVLDRWIDAGKVVFEDNILTLTAENKAYTLTPAVRFMTIVAGDDVVQLIGKVRPLDKLKELGAEHMQDSVIIGDNAYEVQEGYVAIVLAGPEAAAPAPARPAAKAPAPPQAKVQTVTGTPSTENNDADMLTKFLLNNLNF